MRAKRRFNQTMDRDNLEVVYSRLYESYGPQHWWPADTPFEVMVGAVLTQNTAWSNVEKAIGNLKQASCLTPEAILGQREEKIAALIRPSGYFNVKAKRLRSLCQWLLEQGGLEPLMQQETPALRLALLRVHGVGPETADDILLYAFERPVFVIDVYTRRLFTRLGLINGTEDYETLRGCFESALPADHRLFNEYHALIVRHAKERCNGEEKAGCRHCLVEAPLGHRSPPGN